MKKSILILSSVLFFISCGNNTDKKETSAEPVVPVKETKDIAAERGLDLMSKSDCFTCHKLNESSIGPAYAAVADKYKTMDKQAAMDSIVHQIRNGGSGKWGSVAMQAHPLITKEEGDTMAMYIMSVKSEK